MAGMAATASTTLRSSFCPAPEFASSNVGVRGGARIVRTHVQASAALPVVELAAQVVSGGGLGVIESDGISGLQFAVAGGGAIAALAAALSFADPEKRRQKQAAETGGDEKAVVRNYFNTKGFERWNRIYGETDDVNTVQLDIRTGHAQTVEKVLRFLGDRPLEGVTVCDAGCGTGSLSIPLALQGAHVYASDISSAMVEEAARRAGAALSSSSNGKPTQTPKFEACDLESITGKYDTVACLDVLIHYPQDKASAMVQHLASLAENRLLLSFAPYTLYYSVLKRIGELFPGPSKATRAYLHAEDDVEAALKEVGWVVRRREMTGTKFYFSRLLEAVPAAKAQ
ncbi:hypothetical protein KC19_4G203200 [Ceratodon purpureus]|uniref:Magnesium-protoporphyrin IX methyltransferase C-terminal domain-containing protein n=1 Tax=Ceratodon purpureus TaxID=3225 RepID=A0A8T0IBN8_CERPU|nr:hypothetical protein KC19_4G203200 [Ceratodon purpureus]